MSEDKKADTAEELLTPWPEDLAVPLSRRDVTRVLRNWDQRMPAHLRGLLGQLPATAAEEAEIRGEQAHA